MKTILVATDYSQSAESAIKYASFIASFTKANVALFNNYVFNIHALNGLIPPNAMDDIVKSNQDKLHQYAERMSLKYKRPLSAYSITSMTPDALDQLIDKLDIGLIVMGMRKDSDEDHLTGITSNAIITNTKVPVLVVPEGIVLKMPERVLYACDYQAAPKEEHLATLKDIAKVFGSELQVFHVYKNAVGEETDREEREFIINEIESSIASVNHTYRNVKAKDFVEGLKKGITEFDADLLVMSPHKYGFWNSLIHKSKTREMVFKSAIPLLAIPS